MSRSATTRVRADMAVACLADQHVLAHAHDPAGFVQDHLDDAWVFAVHGPPLPGEGRRLDVDQPDGPALGLGHN